jgi:predicted MFS family arabinose efflux permease
MGKAVGNAPVDICIAAGPAVARPVSSNAFWRANLVVAMGIMATSLAQDKFLGRIPLRNLLKNGLHLDRSASATFLFAIGFAWYLKPLFGALIDAFPLLGSRRRSYMIIGSALAALGWAVTGFVSQAYEPLFLAMLLTCCAMVVASCATGGLLVETAQASGGAGRLASIRQLTTSLCVLVGSPVSGYLAGVAFGWTAMSCALVAASLIPVTLFFLKEPHLAPRPLSALGEQWRVIAAARPMWAAAGLMLVFYIAPGTETALFYRQQNDLQMSTATQGWLAFTAHGAGIISALAYTWLCRRLSLRRLLLIGIGSSVVTQALFLFYDSVPAAFAIEGTNGIGFALAELAFLDLSARATPRGSESLGYSLMVSVRNLALFGTDIIGAHLMDNFGWRFTSLVWINTATSVLALPCVFLLPKALLAQREA